MSRPRAPEEDLGILYLLFTPELCRGDPWWTLERALRGGVDLVQWRAPPDADDLRRCVRTCHAYGVRVLVNDHLSLAEMADGLHVGQDDVPAARARRVLGPGKLVGVSTHGPEQVCAAQAAGADYVGLGPCRPTPVKGYTSGLAPDVLRESLAAARVPVFAIGGIDAANVSELVPLGVRRIAVCRAVLAAGDPESAARELRAALHAAQSEST